MRRHWEDQEAYLQGLAELQANVKDWPLIVKCDFSPRIDQRSNVSRNTRPVLKDAVPGYLTTATSTPGHMGPRCIDHIALIEELAAESLRVVSNTAGVSKLSDHFSVGANWSIWS